MTRGKGLAGVSFEGKLRSLGLPGLETRRLRGDFMALCSFPRKVSRQGGAGLCYLVTKDRMHGNGRVVAGEV